MTRSPNEDEENDQEDLIRQAEAFERRLFQDGSSSWSAGMDAPRIASVLKLLNATLRPDKTHLHGGADVSEMLDLPPMVGRFRVGEKIGEGSFGVVHRARDTVLDRDVALKAVPLRPEMQTAAMQGVDPRAADGDYRMIEARAAAKLNHPNLVPLYEVLEDERCLYLVSEFCDGPNLAEYLKQHPGGMPVDLAAEVTLNLAQAVAHAHGRGLIHRDIKPGNVLLSPEKASDDLLPFTPRLTDFGLVLDADNDLDRQANHRLAGTILYMSPEQVMGDRTCDAKSGDIYALGLILYQMLAGRLPYRSSSTLKLMQELCVEVVEPIPADEKAIPSDLHAIYLKALQKEPADRYVTAQEMLDDLLRYRDGREVAARPRSIGERVIGAMRQEPLVSSLVAMLIGLIIGSLFLFGWNNRQLRRQGDSLAEALAAASQSKREAIEVAYHSDLQKAFRANIEGDTATARATIREVERYSRGVVDDRYDLRMIKTLSSDGWFEVDRLEHPITEIVLIPNTDCFAVSSEDNVVRFYQNDGRLVRTIAIDDTSTVHAMAASPDGRWIAVGTSPAQSSWWFGDAGSVEFYETKLEKLDHASRSAAASIPLKDVSLGGFATTIESLAFSLDGKRLAVGSRYEPVRVFDLAETSAETFVDNTRRSEDLCFMPDGRLLLSPSPGQTVLRQVEHERDAETIFDSPLHSVRRLACSPDGRWVAMTLVDDATVSVMYRSDDGNEQYTLNAESGAVNSLRFCEAGETIVCGTIGGTIAMWNLADVQSKGRSKGRSKRPSDIPIDPTYRQVIHNADVTAIVSDGTGNIFSGGQDGSLIAWRPADTRSSKQHPTMPHQTSSIAMLPDASAILIAHLDGGVERLDLQTGERTMLRQSSGENCRSIFVSEDGRWVALGFLSGKVLVARMDVADVADVADWDWTELPKVTVPASRFDIPFNMVFMPSGSKLCVVRGRYHVQWIDLQHDGDDAVSVRAVETSAFRSQTSIHAMAVLDDDRVMMIGDVVSFCHADAGHLVDSKRGVKGTGSACFDAQQGLVYVGCLDGRIRVLDVAGELVASSERWIATPTLEPTERTIRGITSIKLSPDGCNLIAGSSLGEVAIWDAKSLRMLGIMDEGNGIGAIGALSISTDGRVVASHEQIVDLGEIVDNGRLTLYRMGRPFGSTLNSRIDDSVPHELTHFETTRDPSNATTKK